MYRDDVVFAAVNHGGRNLSTSREEAAQHTDARMREERLRAAMEGSLDAIFWLESVRSADGEIEDFVFVDMNAAAERQMSMNRGELLGRRICEAFPINRTAGFFEQYKRVVETRQPLNQEYEVPAPHAAPGYYWHLVVPVGDGVIITNRDMTEQKRTVERLAESEDRFRSAFERSAHGMLLVRPGGTILQSNQAFADFLGRSRDELIGASIRDITFPEDWPATKRAIVETAARIRAGEPDVLRMEKRYAHASGKPVWGAVTAAAVRNQKGEILHRIAQVIDITAQKEQQAEREHLEAQLGQAQKMEAIGQMAGGIAHDFNNILSAILGNTELLAMDLADSAEAMDSIHDILGAVRRGRDLVKQILLFSRRSEQSFRPMRVDKIVHDTIRMFRSALPAPIEIRERIAMDLPEIKGDPTQVQQVLANLCTNAWHAMESKGGVLSIELSVFKAGPDDVRRVPGLRSQPYVRLLVSDTGVGMDAETQTRVFEPFFTTKPMGKGTGLGLSVVHGIVMSHQGAIKLWSEPGRGARFEIFFPAAITEKQEVLMEESNLPLGNGERILVVDDEAALGRVVVRLLRTLSYEAEWIGNPVDALDIFRRDPSRFQGILLDFSMPHITGLEFAEHVRGMPNAVPIVMMSGFSEPMEPAQLSKLHVRSLLQKPLSQEMIAQALKEALQGLPAAS